MSSGDSGPEDGTAGSAAGHPVFPAAPARLVLASASPRRRELLASLGWEFSLRPADIDESPRPGEAPAAYVERIARAKAAAVAAEPGDLVLAADTTVALAGEPFGKPEDPAGARRMLARLAGRVHDVWTAVALRRVAAAGPTASGTDGIDTALERTAVELAPLDAAAIAAYVATGEPLDKAGAYAIQGRGALLVTRITGNYTNVVGLPLPAVARLLGRAGG